MTQNIEEQPETPIYRSVKRVAARSRVAVAGFMLVLILCPILYAQEDFFSKPTINSRDAGYYLWQDPEGWHLITVSGMELQRFSGEIKVLNGEIERVIPSNVDINDQDITLLDAHTITFSFQGNRDPLGFEFRSKGEAPCITFDLKINDRIDKKNIFVGRRKTMPNQVPFSICR